MPNEKDKLTDITPSTDVPNIGSTIAKTKALHSKTKTNETAENKDQNLSDKPVNTEVREELKEKSNPPQDPPQEKKGSVEMFAIVDWYKLNCEILGPQHLQTLMEKRAKLAAYSVDYARVILKYKKEYGYNHVQRQLGVKIKANELQSQQDPDAALGKTYTNARANELATIANKEFYVAEYEAEANYDGNRLVLNQINEVLSSMQQDIAELRAIRNDNDKTIGDNR